jgi:hypothetical protein
MIGFFSALPAPGITGLESSGGYAPPTWWFSATGEHDLRSPEPSHESDGEEDNHRGPTEHDEIHGDSLKRGPVISGISKRYAAAHFYRGGRQSQESE